jgi:transposase
MASELVERLVPEDLWELFQQVVPAAPERPQGGGRRRSHGDREVLAAIMFVAASPCTWNQLPSVFGPSGVTAFRRFTEWSQAGVWAEMLDKLAELGEAGWSRYAIGSVSARAAKGGR